MPLVRRMTFGGLRSDKAGEVSGFLLRKGGEGFKLGDREVLSHKAPFSLSVNQMHSPYIRFNCSECVAIRPVLLSTDRLLM